MPQCSVCGGGTVLKSGISKKNKTPWKGYKCLDKSCDNMDFVPTDKSISKPGESLTSESRLKILEIASQLACAVHKQEVQLLDEVLNYYKGLKFILAEKSKPEQSPTEEEYFAQEEPNEEKF